MYMVYMQEQTTQNNCQIIQRYVYMYVHIHLYKLQVNECSEEARL